MVKEASLEKVDETEGIAPEELLKDVADSPMVKSEPVQPSQPSLEQQVVENPGAMAAHGEEEAYNQYKGYEGYCDPTPPGSQF